MRSPRASRFLADGKKLYVALNLSNRLAELDAATGKILQMWDVGVAPYDEVLAGNKIDVSNWGGRRPEADSVTATAGHGTLVRVDDRGIANESSVTVIAAGGTNSTEILAGLHAGALALSPDKKFLVVANTSSDTLSVIDTRTDKIVETICARQNSADLFGAQPNALAFDKSGKKLFVCNGTQNAVAVFSFQPGASKLLGLIPVGWFPGRWCSMRRRRRSGWRTSKILAIKKKSRAWVLASVRGITPNFIPGRFPWCRCRPTKVWP